VVLLSACRWDDAAVAAVAAEDLLRVANQQIQKQPHSSSSSSSKLDTGVVVC
jgi:hypothetical protein